MNLMKKLLLTATTIACLSLPVYAEDSKIDNNFHGNVGFNSITNFNDKDAGKVFTKTKPFGELSLSGFGRVAKGEKTDIFLGFKYALSKHEGYATASDEGKINYALNINQTNPFVRISFPIEGDSAYLTGELVMGNAKLNVTKGLQSVDYSGSLSGTRFAIGGCGSLGEIVICSELFSSSVKADFDGTELELGKMGLFHSFGF